MRYTLRLLTAQQFQRATALVCAAELARQADEATWGSEPFRIGLWVGTDVSPKRFEEADEQLTQGQRIRRAPADGAADPALPVVWHPDHRRAGQGRRHGAAGVRLLRRRAGALPVRQRRRRSARACRS